MLGLLWLGLVSFGGGLVAVLFFCLIFVAFWGIVWNCFLNAAFWEVSFVKLGFLVVWNFVKKRSGLGGYVFGFSFGLRHLVGGFVGLYCWALSFSFSKGRTPKESGLALSACCSFLKWEGTSFLLMKQLLCFLSRL